MAAKLHKESINAKVISISIFLEVETGRLSLQMRNKKETKTIPVRCRSSDITAALLAVTGEKHETPVMEHVGHELIC